MQLVLLLFLRGGGGGGGVEGEEGKNNNQKDSHNNLHSIRPDIIVMVDWVFKNIHLSILRPNIDVKLSHQRRRKWMKYCDILELLLFNWINWFLTLIDVLRPVNRRGQITAEEKSSIASLLWRLKMKGGGGGGGGEREKRRSVKLTEPAQ